MKHRTLILAHRGDNRSAPQNTLPAFKNAMSLCVDGFETDIHETNDGELVICHNYSINKTSDGKGKISQMSLKDLLQYDFGGHFGSAYKGTRIPRLRELFDMIAAVPGSVDIMDLELKPPKAGEKDLAEKLIAMIKEYGFEEKVYISSFDENILRQVKAADKNIKTMYIYPQMKNIAKQHFITPYSLFIKLGVSAVSPHFKYLTKRRTALCRALGIKVFPWTLNDEKSIKKMQSFGVDGIITDVPYKAKLILSHG